MLKDTEVSDVDFNELVDVSLFGPKPEPVEPHVDAAAVRACRAITALDVVFLAIGFFLFLVAVLVVCMIVR